MELTEVKSGLLGYKKADVVRYISELNELHNAQISAKSEEYAQLKGQSDKEIETLNANNKLLEEKVASLEEAIKNLKAEYEQSVNNYNAMSDEFEALKAETQDLRDKSDIISTAIINAEKCAGQMIDQAKEDADDMIRNAEDKVRYEKDKLNKAKDYVRQARAELRNTMHEIDSALSTAEAQLDAKAKSVYNDEAKQEKKIDISLFKRA